MHFVLNIVTECLTELKQRSGKIAFTDVKEILHSNCSCVHFSKTCLLLLKGRIKKKTVTVIISPGNG